MNTPDKAVLATCGSRVERKANHFVKPTTETNYGPNTIHRTLVIPKSVPTMMLFNQLTKRGSVSSHKYDP